MKIERFEDIEAWQLARELTPSEFEDVYEQARRIPPRRDCPWLYQLPEEIRRAKDLNNHDPPNREPKKLCSYFNCAYSLRAADHRLLTTQCR